MLSCLPCPAVGVGLATGAFLIALVIVVTQVHGAKGVSRTAIAALVVAAGFPPWFLAVL